MRADLRAFFVIVRARAVAQPHSVAQVSLTSVQIEFQEMCQYVVVQLLEKPTTAPGCAFVSCCQAGFAADRAATTKCATSALVFLC